jgi:hypothetical protein
LRRFTSAIAAGAALLILLACSVAGGGSVQIATGDASAAENSISIEAPDWTYRVPLDVTWVDATNSWHEGGRPECLTPSDEMIQITFAYVPVTVEGISWREVVWVSCR